MDGHTHTHHITSSFTRRYQLPSNTDTDGITAKLENGVLTLHVFKAVIPDIPDKEIRVQSAPAEATTAPSVPADNVVHGPSDGDAASSHIDKEQKDPVNYCMSRQTQSIVQ